MEPVQLIDEPPAPTQPQPQGTNPPSEAEAANLVALQAEAQAEEQTEEEQAEEE